MSLVALEDSSIVSRAKSVVAKDSVDGINTSGRRDDVPGSAEDRSDRARESHGDASKKDE